MASCLWLWIFFVYIYIHGNLDICLTVSQWYPESQRGGFWASNFYLLVIFNLTTITLTIKMLTEIEKKKNIANKYYLKYLEFLNLSKSLTYLKHSYFAHRHFTHSWIVFGFQEFLDRNILSWFPMPAAHHQSIWTLSYNRYYVVFLHISKG